MTALSEGFRDFRSKAKAKLRGASLTSQTARRWLIAGFIPTAALFIAVGLWRTWTTAYLLLTGSMPPAQASAGLWGVLLSVAGYLLVPLVIGTAVAGLFTRAVERAGENDFNAAVQRELHKLVESGEYAKVPPPPAVSQAGGAAS
jgi:hypothetical protein